MAVSNMYKGITPQPSRFEPCVRQPQEIGFNSKSNLFLNDIEHNRCRLDFILDNMQNSGLPYIELTNTNNIPNSVKSFF